MGFLQVSNIRLAAGAPCLNDGASMATNGEKPDLKPMGSFHGVTGALTLILLWVVLYIPMLSGIRSLAGEGWRGDILSAMAFASVSFGSFWAFNCFSKTEWHSTQKRQDAYFWTYTLIWGSAALLFWPKG